MIYSQADFPIAVRRFVKNSDKPLPVLWVYSKGQRIDTIPDSPCDRELLKRKYPDVHIKNYNRPLHIKDDDTVAKVFRKVKTVLNREGLIDEYFSLSERETGNKIFSQLQGFIACYPVTGGSEGHYIHVDVVQYPNNQLPDGRVVHLITGKTFLGMEHAAKIAMRCIELLGV